MKSSIRRAFEQTKAFLKAKAVNTQVLSRRLAWKVSRGNAILWHWSYWARYHFSIWLTRHGVLALVASVIVLICASILFAPVLQNATEPLLVHKNRLDNLRSLFIAVGVALIGGTVIVFSLIMFAVQVNIERTPYGLFRKLSKDPRIMWTFVGTFVLAITVACASQVPDASWAAAAILSASWGTVLTIMLFFYAYRRALLLINPLRQLNLIVKSSSREMKIWVRRAKRAAPLFTGNGGSENVGEDSTGIKRDVPRAAYFEANPHWTDRAKQAIQHAFSLARLYVGQGDYEVYDLVLSAVVMINRSYVVAKGRTFFSNDMMIDTSLSTDDFINDTLEHLRRNVRFGVAQGDEQQIELTLKGIAALVQVYADIDYSGELASKTHASLAARYLSQAVETVVPYNMVDVLMEGVRLMGQSARTLLARGDLIHVTTIADRIGVIASMATRTEEYYPVIMTAFAEFAKLTLALIRTPTHDIRFAAGRVKEIVSSVAKLFLAVPETPLARTHGTYLGPYYSSTSVESLQFWLTNLINTVVEGKADHETARRLVGNIEIWSNELHRFEKELLLLTVEKRSHFTFDMIHWITHVTKLLLALSNAPACDEHTRNTLRNNADWLISTLAWIPDDRDTVAFVENFQMTESLFEAAIDAYHRRGSEVFKRSKELLMEWAFKGGRHEIGWGILERSVYGLAALAVIEGTQGIQDLKSKIANRLSHPDALEQELLDRTARDIRQRAATLYREGHWSSGIEREMAKVDRMALETLLKELADLLSPGTSGEEVCIDIW